MRLFEARTVFEDLAVIARLRARGVIGDVVFGKPESTIAAEDIQFLTRGGAVRLVQLDTLDEDRAPVQRPASIEAHLKSLEQVRGLFESLATGSAASDRAWLTSFESQLPILYATFERVNDISVFEVISARELNSVAERHRALLERSSQVVAALEDHCVDMDEAKDHEALADALDAFVHLLRNHALFGPKPQQGQAKYDLWRNGMERTIMRAQRVLDQVDRPTDSKVRAM